MGFLDKVKASAEQALQQGQDKLDEVQAKKQSDGLLRQLGSWHYAIETGRDDGNGAAEIARITAALADHEAANGPLDIGQIAPVPPPPAPSGSVPPPPPGSVPPPPPGSF